MTSQVCEHCGADVPRDEQFCPSCGSFVDPLATPKPTAKRDKVISVTSDGPSYEEFELGSPPPAEASKQPSGVEIRTVECPSCRAVNPAHNRHCQECGARLSQGPLPTAPRPAVQTTPGVRAAMAISGLLLGIILIALLFNALGGDDTSTTTAVAEGSTTAPAPAEIGPIDVLDATCDPEGIATLSCNNLTNGLGTEYQIDYEELADGDTIVIRLTFREPMAINRIEWTNLTGNRFKQNYRARGLSITAGDTLTPVIRSLDNVPGPQSVDFASLDTVEIVITIESAYLPEVVDGNSFNELAIDEITVIGRPVIRPAS